ncbi:MAG: O-antigen ligase family protein [Aridibacter famidurans]|nr:O-antigen ligase family protein [Aridibacter famidurans]
MIESTRVQVIRRNDAIQRQGSREFNLLLLVSLLHLPLGIAIYSMGSLALLHPYAAFAVGLYWAANKKFSLERVAFAIAYIVGAEVLWRMAAVPVFWEFGKYGTTVIAIVALVRRGRFDVPKLPLAYFLLLLPACVLLLTENSFSSVQGMLSMQMSGPLLLVVASWFFASCTFDYTRLKKLLVTVAVPLFSVAFATLFFTVTVEDINFTGESNFATSGGFGPNQVSGLLGLGAFIAIMSLIIFRNSSKYYLYLIVAAVFFTAQSVMTFSRSGIYNAAGAVIVVLLLSLRKPSIALRRAAPVLIAIVLFLVFVFPFMDEFTGGQLSERFQDTGTAARTTIAESDLELFLNNPVFGVGIGASYSLREALIDRKAMTHTEFSRLLSEHGMFGLVALVLLGLMIVFNFKRQQGIDGRAFVAGAAVWSCLFMTNSAMRLAAPSFMLGLTFVTIAARKRRFALKYKREVEQKEFS